MKRMSYAAILCAALCSLSSAQTRSEAKDPGVRQGTASAGEPVAGIDFQYFANLRSMFNEVHSIAGDIEPAAGLGPRFNGTSCGGCHSYPSAGGSSPFRNPQFAFAKEHGARNLVPEFLQPDGPVRAARAMSRQGEVVPLFTIMGRSDARHCFVQQPDWGGVKLSFRIPTPTFGAGLVESISDAAILDNQRLNAAAKRELGIAGRPNRSDDGLIGRFGWKAQHHSLLRFTGEAYETEMGIPNEVTYSVNREPLAEGCYALYSAPYDDPTSYAGSYNADGGSPVFMFAEFMRVLNQPVPVSSWERAGAQSIRRGSGLFDSSGCGLCHTPSLATDKTSEVPAMNGALAHIYSDLLIHHMGPRLADGVTQGLAGPDEFRTAPLWGIGQRIFFLHDGRTTDLLAAIREHKSSGERSESEANTVIDRFEALSASERQDLLNFLRSL